MPQDRSSDTRSARDTFRLTVALLVLLVLLSPTLALAQTAQVVEYYHLDALGSVRVVTDQAGQVVSRHDFLPFGEEYPGVQPAAKEKKLFTGHEHDAETGLDYFGARYYEAQVGRFTTIDPVYTWKDNLTDPQRWNRYCYVRNNPLRFTDPDGRVIFDWEQFKVHLNEIRNFGRDGYGYAVPTVAAVAAVGSVANDLLMAVGVGEGLQAVRAATSG